MRVSSLFIGSSFLYQFVCEVIFCEPLDREEMPHAPKDSGQYGRSSDSLIRFGLGESFGPLFNDKLRRQYGRLAYEIRTVLHVSFFIVFHLTREHPAAGRTIGGKETVVQVSGTTAHLLATSEGMVLPQQQSGTHHRAAHRAAQAPAVAHGPAERRRHGDGLRIVQPTVQATV
jgi:hypothetical protein